MSVAATLERVLERFPAEIRSGQLMQVARLAFEVSLVADRVPKGGRVCDIGGGWGSFALGCAALGYRTTLVDDFLDQGFAEGTSAAMRALYAEYGLEVVARDVVRQGLDFAEGSLDAVTLFDTIEHWHGSPKRALHDAVRALRPGGLMVIATPNCVNLRKRLTVPFGRGKWSSFSDWYEPSVFRGHVREPDVDDLRVIAGDLGLRDVQVIGRNWNGHYSASRLTRALTAAFDPLIRLKPSFCSDLYLIGHSAPA
jgi:SAM-dependent methyltransferase